MAIMAYWWWTTLQASENIDYDTEVGVDEIPAGTNRKATSTLSYNWLCSVDANYKSAEAAWDFIHWPSW
jgi:maltose-binding protein MalE